MSPLMETRTLEMEELPIQVNLIRYYVKLWNVMSSLDFEGGSTGKKTRWNPQEQNKKWMTRVTNHAQSNIKHINHKPWQWFVFWIWMDCFPLEFLQRFLCTWASCRLVGLTWPSKCPYVCGMIPGWSWFSPLKPLWKHAYVELWFWPTCMLSRWKWLYISWAMSWVWVKIGYWGVDLAHITPKTHLVWQALWQTLGTPLLKSHYEQSFLP